MRSLGVKQIIDAGLVEREGSQLLILTPTERKEILESKHKEKLSIIDRIHYLYWLWRNDKIFSFEKGLSEGEKILWKDNRVFKALKYLNDIENDRNYENIIKFLKDKW